MTKKYLLDTNILSEIMRIKANIKVINWIDQQAFNQLYISSITIAEIQLGIAYLEQGKKKQKLSYLANDILIQFQFQTLNFDTISAIKYAEIVADCKKKGQAICVEDAQISSIALTNKMILVTRNIKDFKIVNNLTILNPFN